MGRKLLLEKEHIEGIRYYDTYRKNGGYAAVEKAFKMSPNDNCRRSKKVACAVVVVQVFLQV